LSIFLILKVEVREQIGTPGEMEVIGALCKLLKIGGAGGGTRTPTGLPLLDFESDAQNHRSFLYRVTPLCPVCAVGLGTIFGTVGVA